MAKTKLTIKTKETYLAQVTQSVGSKMFQHIYANNKGRTVDILKNGELSCAYFVSCVLKIFDLITNPHATVSSTVKDMLQSGWQQIPKPRVGSVLVWNEKTDSKGESHAHIGFYIGNNIAISNSTKTKTPAKHHWTYNSKRKVEQILWHKQIA